MIERRLKMTKRDVSPSNTTPPGAGTARTGAAVRDVFETALAAAGKAEVGHASATTLAAALRGKAATAEKVAAAYQLELVAGSARSLWLRAGTEEWAHLDNPTDAIQASVQAAFCNPECLQVAFRYRSDVIVELVVQSIAPRSKSQWVNHRL
jgi:hypothetical protein